jgi:hypothetical protein
VRSTPTESRSTLIGVSSTAARGHHSTVSAWAYRASDDRSSSRFNAPPVGSFSPSHGSDVVTYATWQSPSILICGIVGQVRMIFVPTRQRLRSCEPGPHCWNVCAQVNQIPKKPTVWPATRGLPAKRERVSGWLTGLGFKCAYPIRPNAMGIILLVDFGLLCSTIENLYRQTACLFPRALKTFCWLSSPWQYSVIRVTRR